MRYVKSIFFIALIISTGIVMSQDAFCDSRGPDSECLINQDRDLNEKGYGFSSVFVSEASSSFSSNGMANIQVFNTTFISGLWEGSFNISTNETVIRDGAKFKPENGRIIVGSVLPDEMANFSTESCDAVTGESNFYSVDPDGTGSFEVYCEMSVDGGGWTHVATYADDGNNYWTSNNRDYIINGNEYNTPENGTQEQDFQSKAYSTVKADEVMVRRANNPDKYLIYDILNDQTLESRYVGGTSIVGTFFTDEVSGSWYRQCGNDIALRLQTPDSDADGWNSDNGGYGFYFESTNNNGCSFDDYAGGVYGDDDAWGKNSENTWNRGFFFEQNFGGSAMEVFIRKDPKDNEFNGIDQGYVSGNINWRPNRFDGSSNAGEIDIECPSGDSSCWLYTQDKNITGTDILDINKGIVVQESGSRQYYVMYSNESVHTRFSNAYGTGSDHFIAVARANGKWYYDDNSNLNEFVPRKHDTLVANFTEGVTAFDSYEGLEG